MTSRSAAVAIAMSIITAGGSISAAYAQEAAPACQRYTAAEVAAAISNSPNAGSTLKNAACDFGGAAIAESGGRQCASNGNNFGVLQLTRSNLPAGMTPEEYMALPLEEQVNIWAQQTGGNIGSGYRELSDAITNGTTIGGVTPTAGMLKACFQFGPVICRNNVAFMRDNNGACPSPGNGGVNINDTTRATRSTANLDGNGQSICSWGRAIQRQINANAAACRSNQAACVDSDFPTPGGSGTSVAAATPPVPSASDVFVASGQV